MNQESNMEKQEILLYSNIFPLWKISITNQ